MALEELVEPSIQTLTAHFSTNKLLLIHPSSRYRTLLIAELINNPPCPLFYFGLGISDTTLTQFLTSLAHDLADQKETFGRYINEARNQTPDDFEQLAVVLQNIVERLMDKPSQHRRMYLNNRIFKTS